MARVTYDYLKNLDPEDLSKMKKSQVIDLLRKARKKYDTRSSQLEKANVSSAAKTGMEKFYSETGRKAPSKISRNKAINEILRISQFMNAESSTVKGARAVERRTAARIFGENKAGRAKAKLTKAQWDKFWAIHNEFRHQYKNADVMFGSNNIQQQLGDMLIKMVRAKQDIPDYNDIDFLALLYERLREIEFEMMEEDDLDDFFDDDIFSHGGVD